MANDQQVNAMVSMLIGAGPAGIYDAFVKPEWLTQFWLSNSSGPLQEGEPVEWSFKVPGAQDTVTATCLDQE